MSSELTLDAVELLLHDSFLGLRNGDSIKRMLEVLGAPEATSSPKREPIIYKYGNVQITCIGGRVFGVGIDLSNDAPPPPDNLNLSGIMSLCGLSRSEAETFFRERNLELVAIDSISMKLVGARLGFLSFENDVIYRAGLLMHG